MSKKTVIIPVVLIVLLVLLVIGAVMMRSYAASKVMNAVSGRLPGPLSLEARLSPVWKHPFCYDEIVIRGTGKTLLTVGLVCLESGIFDLVSDDPIVEISCAEAVGTVEHSLLKSLSEAKKSGGGTEKTGTGRLQNMTARLEVAHLRMTYLHENAGLTWEGKASAFLDHGVAQIISDAQPSFDIKKSPVALTSSPEMQAVVQADLKQKTGSLRLTGNPGMSLAFALDDQIFDVNVRSVEASFGQEKLTLAAHGIHVESPGFEGIAVASLDSVSVLFGGMKPGIGAIESVRVESPFLSLNTKQLLKSEQMRNNVIFQGAMDFWKKDAGSILGDAPKKSVRRADVKGDKTTYKKNPISKKTLDEVRSFFDGFQAKIRALPAIDIRNGRVDIVHEQSHFEFDAISFNTAELFRDAQRFQLDFNMRRAAANFWVAYEDNSPYPEITFSIKGLDATDFLKIINMPVPEKNDGTVSMNLKVSMSDEWLRFAGSIDFADFTFYHEKISPNVIQNIDASAILEVEYNFKDDGLKVSPVRLRSGGLEAAGWLSISNVRSNPVIEFELGAKDIPCADIPKAIPTGFLPTITDLEMAGGTISPKITGKIPWKNPLVASLKETGFEGTSCYPVSVAPHHPEVLNDPGYTFTTDYTYFTDSITVGPGTKDYVPLEEIPPYVRAAMFLTEDKRFFDHGPLRIAFIERALRLNLNQRSYVYGGSTIAQQLTKNLFLNRSKNLARKLEEAFVAWRLVTVVPKSRIFEMYVNVIEFGPDVYGIKKASKFYFDKEPKDLTPLEGAYLASLKVSPSKGGRFYKTGFGTGGWWHKRMRYVLKVLAENGYISVPEVVAAYDWTPKFVYPTQAGDFRQVWLNHYGEYLRERARQKKAEEREAAGRGNGGE